MYQQATDDAVLESGQKGWRRRAVFALVAVALAPALGGCSGGGSAPVLAHMAVTLQDFKLSTGSVEVPAGRVIFDVTNDGPSTHEFNVDKTTLDSANLPLDDTGLFVAEDSPLLHRQGSVESAGLGTRHQLTLSLAPGTYVVYCDLEGHYLSGMHVTIHVQ